MECERYSAPLMDLKSSVTHSDAFKHTSMFSLRAFIQRRLNHEAGYHLLPISTDLLVHPQIQWLQPTTRSAWLWSVLPWFIAAPLGKTARTLPKVSSTSYLNGVRGIACFLVFNYHLTGHSFSYIHNAYCIDPVEDNSHLTQLPFINLIYASHGAVSVFFVLSGFVLSYSPLRIITSGAPADELLTGLSSALIRRGIRLFGPMIVLAGITCVFTYHYPSFHPGDWTNAETSFFSHIWRFVHISLPAMNPFSWEVYHPPGFEQGWTLGMEYRGSLVIFLLCLAGAKLSSRARKCMLVSSAVWAIYWERWENWCFIWGMVIAELRFSPLSSDSKISLKVPDIVKRMIATGLLLFSILLCSWPESGATATQPYKAISYLVPASWQFADEFWYSVGAVGLLFAMENMPLVQWVMAWTPILYLGEISFSFYLLHWLIYLSLGVELQRYFDHIWGWSGVGGFYAMYGIVFLVLLVTSDWYWRGVDEKCVLLGKKVVDWLGISTTPARLAVVLEQDSEEGGGKVE